MSEEQFAEYKAGMQERSRAYRETLPRHCSLCGASTAEKCTCYRDMAAPDTATPSMFEEE